jgi:hypothetical protein
MTEAVATLSETLANPSLWSLLNIILFIVASYSTHPVNTKPSHATVKKSLRNTIMTLRREIYGKKTVQEFPKGGFVWFAGNIILLWPQYPYELCLLIG